MARNQDLALGFVRTEAPKHAPAFGVPSDFDQQRALFVPRTIPCNLELALRQYQELGCAPRFEINPSQCSWNDVLDKLTEAQTHYESKTEGWSGLPRKVMRGAGNHAESISAFVGMMPTTPETSFIPGIVQWTLELAKAAADRRQAVFDTFKDVPMTIKEVAQGRKDFPRDDMLRDLDGAFTTTMVQTLSTLIAYLLPKSKGVKKVVESLHISGRPSGKEAEEAMAKLRGATEDLRRRTTVLTQGAVAETREIAKKNNQEMKATRWTSSKVLAGQGELREYVEKSFLDVRQDLQRQEQGIFSQLQSGIAAQNGLYQMVEELRKAAEGYRREVIEAARQQQLQHLETIQLLQMEMSERMAPGYVRLSLVDLSRTLGVSLEWLATDVDRVIREGFQAQGTQSQGLLQILMRQRRFTQWLASDDSDLIIVQGTLHSMNNSNMNSEFLPSSSSRISPLSVICGTILAGLSPTPSTVTNTTTTTINPYYSSSSSSTKTITLYHFIGLHTSNQDPLFGPQGLLRSLLSRLILELQTTNPKREPDFLTIPTHMASLRRYEVPELCSLLRAVLSRFSSSSTSTPTTTVIHCIVDGLLVYEREDLVRDAVETVRCLYDVVVAAAAASTGSRGPVLKVLLASALPLRRIGGVVGVENHVFLGQRGGEGGGGGLLMAAEGGDFSSSRVAMARFFASSRSRGSSPLPPSYYIARQRDPDEEMEEEEDSYGGDYL